MAMGDGGGRRAIDGGGFVGTSQLPQLLRFVDI